MSKQDFPELFKQLVVPTILSIMFVFGGFLLEFVFGSSEIRWVGTSMGILCFSLAGLFAFIGILLKGA